ncbi:DNA cytosine methyltransferase [Nocardia terpenica]|uniref:DNA cytosine methyltransferase n=1 Tax=Nocardia terpenica TaxID=455432 RepID=UPI00142D5290|nr:DNA cytosine methyltransferase [Nocardia terpenica]
MRIGSLCSGSLGFDLAIQKVFGGRLVWVADSDRHAAEVLQIRAPDVPNLGDITQVDWSTVPAVDVVTAGYPCQPFSVAGLRRGENDPRHLWPYVRDAIRTLRPRFTVLENVPGHLKLGFSRVLADLAEDGLHARWVSVRACDIGAPHRRERIFALVTDPSRP